MKLYFGNMVTTVTTLMIVLLVGFVGYSISNRSNINFWAEGACLFWHMVLLYAALQPQGTDWIKQFSIR